MTSENWLSMEHTIKYGTSAAILYAMLHIRPYTVISSSFDPDDDDRWSKITATLSWFIVLGVVLYMINSTDYGAPSNKTYRPVDVT